MTEPLTESPERIADAAYRLQQGGLVAFATETVYGLGANALDAVAVARIFEAKGRPKFDPLIVHVPDADAARTLTTAWPQHAAALAQAFWPGPLTLVLPRATVVPDIVTAGLDTVALRVPSHPLALALLRAANVPIAAPSANRFGSISPTTAAHVRDEFGNDIDMVLDGGPCLHGVESTVLSLADGRAKILRPGGLAREAIEAVIGAVDRASGSTSNPASPGMLDRHYAPRTPLDLVEGDPAPPRDNERVGLIALTAPPNADAFAAVEVLDEHGDLPRAAARLFAAMRRLDQADLERIVAVRVVDQGLGVAINDRLTRASRR